MAAHRNAPPMDMPPGLPSFDQITRGAPGDRELVHIGGDVPDPSRQTSTRGFMSTVRLDKTAWGHPIIQYRDRAGNDFVLTADVYRMPDAPLKVMLFCPRCSTPNEMHTLSITSDRKKIEYDPKAGDPAKGGRLSIEAFKCTWAPCSWRVFIDDNVAHDA
jgi:hypothetical protein